MDDLLKTFFLKGGWAGLANWSDQKSADLWLASDVWLNQQVLTGPKQGVPTGNSYQCLFFLGGSPGKGAGVSKDFFWLTQLLGIGDSTLGLYWVRNGVGKRPWRVAVGQQPEIIAKLRALGFEYQEAEGSFYLQVRVDQSTLAQAVADESPELALAPFSDALQACANAKPHFDALLAATATSPAAASGTPMPSLLAPMEVA